MAFAQKIVKGILFKPFAVLTLKKNTNIVN